MTRTFGKEDPFIMRLAEKIQRVNEVDVLPQTIDRARRQLEEVERRLAENATIMGDMGRDGDMMDDPLLHGAQEANNSLTSQRAILGRFTQIAKPRQIDDTPEKVGYGRKVVLEFPGEEEERVVLGNVIDAGFGGREILSDESPVGRAIMGKISGEEVLYQVNEGEVKVRIVRVE